MTIIPMHTHLTSLCVVRNPPLQLVFAKLYIQLVDNKFEKEVREERHLRKDLPSSSETLSFRIKQSHMLTVW